MKENYCIICGRKIGGKSSTKYCKKHLNQIQKYGKVLDNNPRNKFDPNEFRFIGNDIVEFDTIVFWHSNEISLINKLLCF